MLKIRLQRFGSKNDPKFRVVLTDSKNSTKSGKFLEILGFYNPVQKEKKLDAPRIKHWISQGAGLTDTIHNLLVKDKIIEGKAINVLPSKTPIKKDVEPDTNTQMGTNDTNKKEETPAPAEKAPEETPAPVEEINPPSPQATEGQEPAEEAKSE